jgi:cytochrome c-type biogenesis protein CcmH
MTPTALPDPSPEEAQTLLRSERFRKLAGELRCLVCQNQTLADSNAELAGDLRAEVLRQMASGKDDAAIKTHLVDRFGEFVLYRPTLSAHNLGLWAGPAVIAALGGMALWRLTRRKALLASSGTPSGSAGVSRRSGSGTPPIPSPDRPSPDHSSPDSSLARINALLGPSPGDLPSSSKPSPGGEGPHPTTRKV